MAKPGDALKEYKIEQKAETTEKIKEAIAILRSSKEKISITKVATLSGISRANIYANYKELFEDISPIESKIKSTEHRKEQKEKNALLDELREENKRLREINNKLMDQLVAMKLLVDSKYLTRRNDNA
jgi:cell division protein ZapA (FtsZ GTPase activity inhibitor)